MKTVEIPAFFPEGRGFGTAFPAGSLNQPSAVRKRSIVDVPPNQSNFQIFLQKAMKCVDF